MDTKKYCFVKFKYIYNPEEFEDVRILGNTDSLGNWDINKAIKLSLNKKEANSWITQKIKIELFFNLEYKYLIFKNNELKKWEDITNNDNRKINLTKKENLILLDKPQFFSPQITIEKKNIFSSFENDDLNELNYESDYDEKIEAKKIIEELPNEIVTDINDNDDILMFSFYLPVNIEKNDEGEINFVSTNEALYHTLYRIIKNKKNIKWFGFLKEEKNIKEEERENIRILLEQKNFYLLDIDIDLYDKLLELIKYFIEPDIYYTANDQFSIIDFKRMTSLWEAYKEFNEYIADIIIKYLTKNSLIYFHDYHFLLVANALNNLLKHNTTILENISIGIFIHSPFPSYDIFKNSYYREEILKSMLKSKVIGFHSFDSSRNFITSSKILLNINLLSTNKGDLAVNYLENNTLIRVKNVSPELDLIKNDIYSDEFKYYYHELEKKYDKSVKKYIFISVEQTKFLLSIKNKLEGYKKFLEMGGRVGGVNCDPPKNANIFLIYIRYSKDELDVNGNIIFDENQKKMMANIEKLVNEIKSKFGEDTIELYKGKIPYRQRLALFAFSNCFVRTSKKESYSLGLYEFLIMKKLLLEKIYSIKDLTIEAYSENKDINIAYMISELSGVNTSLGGAIKINPFDYKSIFKGFSSVKTYLSQELNLNKKKEKEHYLSTIKKDFTQAMKSSFKAWFFNFLKDIKNTKLSDENTFFMCNDECLNFKLKKLDKTFKKLDYKLISINYEKAHNRLLFFDFEGTLPSNLIEGESINKGNKPTDEIISLLNELTNDKRNKVFIVAEKGQNQIWEWFKDVNDLGIGIEHGFKYIINKQNKKNNLWTKLIKNYNNSWIQNCVSIITPYTERYEGSFLDIKESSVVWYYTDSAHDLGKNLASILSSELQSLIYEYNLKIVNGKGFIEIMAYGINKGYFLSHILKKQIKKGRIPDFIICVGDDNSDEKMFDFLAKKEKNIKKYAKDADFYSITVGKKPSKAMYYVNSVKNVKELINKFVKISQKTSSSISSSVIRKSNLNIKYDVKNENDKEKK